MSQGGSLGRLAQRWGVVGWFALTLAIVFVSGSGALAATYMSLVKVDGVSTPPCEVIASLAMQIDFLATATNGDTISSLLLQIKNSGGSVVKQQVYNFPNPLMSSGGIVSRTDWTCMTAPNSTGSYTLVVTPCSGIDGGGTQGTPTSNALDVIRGITSTAVSGSGPILSGGPYTITAEVTSCVSNACICAGDSHYSCTCPNQIIGSVVFTDMTTGQLLGTVSVYEDFVGDNPAATGDEIVSLTTTSIILPTGIHTIKAEYLPGSSNYYHASSSGTVMVSVTGDTTRPTITCPGPISAGADAGGCVASVPFEATASDNVSAVVTYAIGATPISSPHDFPVGVTTVTATATDPSSNTATCTFTVTVAETEPPAITVLGANPQTVECGATYSDPGVSVADNCPDCVDVGDVIVSGSVDTSTTSSYTLTYNVTDCNGNPAAAVTRTVNVVDTTPPTINLTGSNPMTVECHTAYVEPGATVTDTCCIDSGNLMIDASSVNVNVVGAYSVTYNIDDCSGNPATEAVRTVNVVDTTPPIITCPGDFTVECLGDVPPPDPSSVSAGDGCDSDPTVTHQGDETLADDSGTYQVLRTYRATDDEGLWVECTQVISVIDTTPPSISLHGDNPYSVECGSSYVDPGATANDNCCLPPAGLVIDASGVDTTTLGTYQVTYNIDDCAGNPADQVSRVVQVVDTTSPVITLSGSNPTIVECHSPYAEPGATAWDNCCVNQGDLVIDSSAVDTATPGTYTVTYDIDDCEGNSAIRVERLVTVIDTVPPAILLNSANPQILELGSAYYELGATVTDGCCVDAGTLAIDPSGVDTDVVGSYVVTYNIDDCSGNPAPERLRTVHVVDTVPPDITIRVPADLATYLLNEWILADWSVTDLSGDLAITATAAVGAPVPTSTGGWHEFTVAARDPSGNESSKTVSYAVHYRLVIDPETGALAFVLVSQGDEPPAPPEDPIRVPYGESIHIGCSILDALGIAITDLQLTLSVVRVTPGGPEETYEILYLVGIDYDDETLCYAAELCRDEGFVLEPGLYDLWLGLGDGRNLNQRIRVEE